MKKKLIEVALPLEAINRESAREKSLRHGHPSTLHLWWARRPLASCRAVLFASLVDDPSAHPERFATAEEQDRERARLFALLERLVRWEGSGDADLLAEARAEIAASVDGDPPRILDPFAGGGSIPLEAQRLGLETHAADLNPIPVVLTRALTDVPTRFRDMRPVGAGRRLGAGGPAGAVALAQDIRHYGERLREMAHERLRDVYPRATPAHGEPREPIAWIWARTVTCPNPACRAIAPLVRSFVLSTKKARPAWVQPRVHDRAVRFEIRTGDGTPPEGTVSRRGARCLVCGEPIGFDHIRAEGRAGRLGEQLMAIAVAVERRREYVAADDVHEAAARRLSPDYAPDAPIADNPGHTNVFRYGMTTWGDLFTDRQLVGLGTFADLVPEVAALARADAQRAGLPASGGSLESGGAGAEAYADAIALYLGIAVDRLADRMSTICTWDSGPKMEALRNTFARQALPMTWDFAELNPFSGSSGSWRNCIEFVARVVEGLPASSLCSVQQRDAIADFPRTAPAVVCTDPPYYDNIGYSDLADYFYVWLRRAIGARFPALFSTLLTPKATELLASAHRFEGDRQAARRHFEAGIARVFGHVRDVQDARYPFTVFYAFRQTETDGGDGSVASTGSETMLEALIGAGFAVTGTWPMRSELGNRMVASGSNALASSIVLVCRPRPVEAPAVSRKDFIAALRRELATAVTALQHGNVAPVDLAQASIGPGMAIFSGYDRVIAADGSRMTVRAALALINQVLDELLAAQEGDFDPATRWALACYEQFGLNAGPFGTAETLSKAKNSALAALATSGILESRAGKVRLLGRDERALRWSRAEDGRLTIWEAVQRLVRRLDGEGETEAAELLAELRDLAEPARELAYRLYSICERKGWTQEALSYNGLIVAWPELARLAGREARLEH